MKHILENIDIALGLKCAEVKNRKENIKKYLFSIE